MTLKAALVDPHCQMFIRAFFTYMWEYDADRPREYKRLLYVVLEGAHDESAIIEVDDSGCPGLSSAIPSVTDGTMAFVHHTDATQFLRDKMSEFFVKNSPLTDSVVFQRKMKDIGDVQLTATLSRLAAGLPLYKVLSRLCAHPCVCRRVSLRVGVSGTTEAL